MIVLVADDPFAPDLGCGIGDWGCYAQQAFAQTLGSICKAVGNFIGDMLTNAFLGAQAQTGDWTVATGHFWFWAVIAGLLVLAIGVWQIGVAVVLQQPGRVLQIAAGMVAGVFLSVLALQWMPTVVTAMSGITNQLTAGLHGPDGVGAAILNILGIGGGGKNAVWTFQPKTTIDVVLGVSGNGTTPAGTLLMALAALGLIALASLVLFISMSIRTFGLILGVAFAPLGLMFYGQPRMKDMAAKWAQLMLGLLLAEPLAAGILLLATNLTSVTGQNGMGLLIVSAGAIFLAAFAPLWAVKFVSFAAGDMQTAMGNSQWNHGGARNAASTGGRFLAGLFRKAT